MRKILAPPMIILLFLSCARLTIEHPTGWKATYSSFYKTVNVEGLRLECPTTGTVILVLNKGEGSSQPGVEATKVLVDKIVELAVKAYGGPIVPPLK